VERIQTPALVARKVEYGEADLILTLLTRERGRISALARSARRSRRRFGGALSLFVVGQATLRPPVRGELFGLESFEGLEDLGGPLAADVVKVAHGSYLLELARELWPASQAEPASFELLVQALRALAGGVASPTLLRAFELQILAAAGLAPSLDRCVRCGGPPSGSGGAVRVDIGAGGVICARCEGGGWPLPGAAHALLLELQRTPMQAAAALAPPAEVARAMRDLNLLLLRHTLGKELRSLEVIAQLGVRTPRP